jgi:hypothetical protein
VYFLSVHKVTIKETTASAVIIKVSAICGAETLPKRMRGFGGPSSLSVQAPRRNANIKSMNAL